jgi:hypothetical protein
LIVWSYLGSLEWTTICEADTVIYSTDEIDPARPPIEFLNHRLFQTQIFLHALWLVLDNAADNDLSFLIYNLKGMPTVSSNFMARDISRADGSKGVLEITRDQLRTARDLLRKCDFGTPDAEYITRLEKTSTSLWTCVLPYTGCTSLQRPRDEARRLLYCGGVVISFILGRIDAPTIRADLVLQ